VVLLEPVDCPLFVFGFGLAEPLITDLVENLLKPLNIEVDCRVTILLTKVATASSATDG